MYRVQISKNIFLQIVLCRTPWRRLPRLCLQRQNLVVAVEIVAVFHPCRHVRNGRWCHIFHIFFPLQGSVADGAVNVSHHTKLCADCSDLIASWPAPAEYSWLFSFANSPRMRLPQIFWRLRPLLVIWLSLVWFYVYALFWLTSLEGHLTLGRRYIDPSWVRPQSLGIHIVFVSHDVIDSFSCCSRRRNLCRSPDTQTLTPKYSLSVLTTLWGFCRSTSFRPRLYLYTVLASCCEACHSFIRLGPLNCCFAFFRCIVPILHHAVIYQIFDVGFWKRCVQSHLGLNRRELD